MCNLPMTKRDKDSYVVPGGWLNKKCLKIVTGEKIVLTYNGYSGTATFTVPNNMNLYCKGNNVYVAPYCVVKPYDRSHNMDEWNNGW